MIYTLKYSSPLGGIVVACDGEALTGLWFEGQKYFGDTLPEQYEEKEAENAGTRGSEALAGHLLFRQRSGLHTTAGYGAYDRVPKAGM